MMLKHNVHQLRLKTTIRKNKTLPKFPENSRKVRLGIGPDFLSHLGNLATISNVSLRYQMSHFLATFEGTEWFGEEISYYRLTVLHKNYMHAR